MRVEAKHGRHCGKNKMKNQFHACLDIICVRVSWVERNGEWCLTKMMFEIVLPVTSEQAMFSEGDQITAAFEFRIALLWRYR